MVSPAVPPELPGAAGMARTHGTAEAPMRTTPRMLAALAIALAAPARADVIEASSTTLVLAGQQTRGGTANTTPDLVTVTPVFEIVTVSAREIRNPVFDNLEVVVSGWGAYDLGDVRWDAGTTDRFTGDLSAAYVRGQLFRRALTVRGGRAVVAAGVGRMLQLDGGDLLLRLPGGVSLSAYGGIPVSQRFGGRSGLRSWNPAGGDLAYGGRLGWSLPFAGAYGRGLDLGASAVVVEDSTNALEKVVRQDVGVDLRVAPTAGLVLVANGTWALTEERLAAATVEALWTVSERLFATADFKLTSPDLFLSRGSILSVFADSDRTDVGGGVRYALTKHLTVGADYHALLEPTGEGSKTELGHEAAGRVEWEQGDTALGGEVTYLTAIDNGYLGLRAFGRRELGKAFVVADVVAHRFENDINGQGNALTGTLSAGYKLGAGWSAVLAGRAGMTPFLEQQADLMVKLVYNQTYRAREVK
jgi:opacity protein-like surface antigen